MERVISIIYIYIRIIEVLEPVTKAENSIFIVKRHTFFKDKPFIGKNYILPKILIEIT